MEIDWGALQSEAKSAGVIPAGEYNVVVTETTATTSSTSKPMVKVKMRVTDGPQKDKPVWTQFVISAESPMALRMFFQHMAAFGLDGNFFAQNPDMDTVASNLMNRAASVTLDIRQWNGADRNEVKGIKPASAGGPLAPGVVTGPPVIGASPTNSASPLSTPNPLPPTAPASTPTAPSAPPTEPF